MVSNALSDKPDELEHIDIAQRYFQYSYSYKLTDEARLQDRVVSLTFALEALLLEENERRGSLVSRGGQLIGDKHPRAKALIEDAYEKIRNAVAHGRKPAITVRKAEVASLENCVRWAIRRAIGLAIGQDIRSKQNLCEAIDNAKGKIQQLRIAADEPFV
jgi:hypothetical protein